MDQQREFERQRMGFGKLVIWLLSMLVVGPAVFTAAVVLILVVWTLPYFDIWDGFAFLLFVLGGVFAGYIVGFVQSLALRHAVPWAGNWMKATVVGWTIAGVLWAAIFFALGGTHFEVSSKDLFIVIPLIGTITGLGIGFGQWLVMQRWLEMPFWWIATTTLAWFLGGVVAYAVFDWGYYVLPMTVAASVAGVGTAIAMKAFIDYSMPKGVS